MPTEEGVGFEDKQGFLPVLDATREEDEPEAVGLRKGRLLDLTVRDDQLLPEQSILGDEVGFTACPVGGGAEHKRMAGWLSEIQKGLFKERNQTDEQLGEQMTEGEHVVGLQERCQKPSEDSIQRFIGVKSQTDEVFSQHSGRNRLGS
jgi:hypothetical protein